MASPRLDAAIAVIQFAYPQIYYACHTRHDRRRSSGAHLSQRDAQILVHLSPDAPIAASRLGAHLGLAPSTTSEALARLDTLGYISRTTAAVDRRQLAVRLTAKGAAAVRAGSVLDAARLRRVLRRLSTRDRAAAVAGLTMLARACVPARAGRPKKERSHA